MIAVKNHLRDDYVFSWDEYEGLLPTHYKLFVLEKGINTPLE